MVSVIYPTPHKLPRLKLALPGFRMATSWLRCWDSAKRLGCCIQPRCGSSPRSVTLARIPDYKITKVDDLLPRRWNR